MPKFRDLGINAIPLTMRPPEVGYGAAGSEENPTQCPQPSTCIPAHDGPDTQCQNPSTCIPAYDGPDTQCHKGRTCKPEKDTTECRGQATCKPDDGEDTQCTPQQDTCGRYQAETSFTPDAVAQLRQQLDSHIDNPLQI